MCLFFPHPHKFGVDLTSLNKVLKKTFNKTTYVKETKASKSIPHQINELFSKLKRPPSWKSNKSSENISNQDDTKYYVNHWIHKYSLKSQSWNKWNIYLFDSHFYFILKYKSKIIHSLFTYFYIHFLSFLRMQYAHTYFLTQVFSIIFSFIIMADDEDATLVQFFKEFPILV